MSKKMDWRTAGLAGKRTLSTKDEAEYRGQDAASRWLERNDKPKGKAKPRATSHPERTAQ